MMNSVAMVIKTGALEPLDSSFRADALHVPSHRTAHRSSLQQVTGCTFICLEIVSIKLLPLGSVSD